MFHLNPSILPQQEVRFTPSHSQHETQPNSQRTSSQPRNKLPNISSPTFDIYRVQDPSFLVSENSTIHHEQVYSQPQPQQPQQPQQFHSPNQKEQTQITQAPPQQSIQNFQTETPCSRTPPTYDNSNHMIDYINANHNWNNQQFHNIQKPFNKFPVESDDDTISSETSSPIFHLNTANQAHPMNAFSIFSQKRRKELSTQNPALTSFEISTILGDEWTSMTAEEKSSYIIQAQELKDNPKNIDNESVQSKNNDKKRKRNFEEIDQENCPPYPFYPVNQQYMYPYPPYNPYTYPSPPAPAQMSMPYNYLPPPPPPPPQTIQIKQSPNAFILFSAKTRPKIKAENPDAAVGEISRMVGNAWKNLPEEEKNKYYEESKRLREENKELKKIAKFQQKGLQSNKMIPPSMYPPSYNYGYPPIPGMPPSTFSTDDGSYSYSVEVKNPAKRTRTPKDPTQPKHPSSAFIFYLHEYRPIYTAKYPKKSLGIISRMIANKWKELTPEEKIKYVRKSEDDKKRYLLEMEIWLENKKKEKNNVENE